VSVKAVVVGAGPAGAALAFVLARRGLEVALVERQKDFAREFRGEAVMPSGIDVFRQLGLEDEFDQLAQARPTEVRIHRNGRLMAEFSAETPDQRALLPRIVSQPQMLEMLVAQASAFPGFRFYRGTSVKEIVYRDGRAIGVRLEGNDEPAIEADVVIGADGRGSVVRRKAGLVPDHERERFDVVWFKVPRPEFLADRDHTALVYLGRGHLMLGFPSYDGTMQFAWIIDKGEFGSLRGRGVESWVEEMALHAGPELGAHLRAHKGELLHPFVLNVVCYLLPRWTAPGLVLLGDAAHPMSPVGGQGINIALRDAVVAANHLVPALEAGATPAAIDAAAVAFQRERYAEVETLQRMQRVPPRFVFQRTWWARGALALAPLFLRLQLQGGARTAVVGRFFFGIDDVRLRV
jgi:2-polyprenyl-6-methoxyphenol hydroxylase-like FAD-dependent oxidoreductase